MSDYIRYSILLIVTQSILLLTSCITTTPEPTPTTNLEATLEMALEQTIAAQPTGTPSSTQTHTPTATFTPSPTTTYTHTPKHSQTSTKTKNLSCSIQDGDWHGQLKTTGLMNFFDFKVFDCSIVYIDLWTYPIPGELYPSWGEVEGKITDEKFRIVKVDEDYGTFIIEGEFESPKTSKGILVFPKGFLVIHIKLPSEVIIEWEAIPVDDK